MIWPANVVIFLLMINVNALASFYANVTLLCTKCDNAKIIALAPSEFSVILSPYKSSYCGVGIDGVYNIFLATKSQLKQILIFLAPLLKLSSH